MPYTFDVVAWQGWDNRRHGGTPPTPQQAKGLKVLVTNPDNSGDTHQFWTFTILEFQDFAEWWVLVGGLMTMHGMDLADEPPIGDGDFDDEEEDEEGPPPPPPIDRPRGIKRIWRRVKRLFRR